MKLPLPKLLSFFVILGASSLFAGEIWTETKYFVPDYALTEKVPVPAGDWKIYYQKKFRIGQGVEGVENLAGMEKGTESWLVGDTIVTFLKTGDAVVEPRMRGDAVYWDSPVNETAWMKNLKPFATNHQDGRKIFVYDNGGIPGKPARRAWISAESLRRLAVLEGKFITVYQQVESNVPVSAPPKVLAAIKQHRADERKLSKFGTMPQ